MRTVRTLLLLEDTGDSQRNTSWGIIDIPFLSWDRPTCKISTLSILIDPDDSLTMRNRTIIIDDLPAPVLPR